MKIRNVILLGLFVLFVVLVSCASGPETPAAAPPPVDTAAPEDEAAVRARAQALAEARSRAEALLAEMDAAREEAAGAGADDIFEERFGAVDDLASSARDKFDSNDYDAAAAAAAEGRDRYLILKTLTEASELFGEANDHDFAVYDPDNYQAGAEAGNNAYDQYNAGSWADALTNAGKALDSFRLVLENGWIGYTNEQSAAAQGWKQAALDTRANVAAREVYADADTIYNQAHIALRSGEYRNAAELFGQSGVLFKKSRDTAVEKRVRAEDSLRQAERRVSESGEKASAAQEIVGNEE